MAELLPGCGAMEDLLEGRALASCDSGCWFLVCFSMFLVGFIVSFNVLLFCLVDSIVLSCFNLLYGCCLLCNCSGFGVIRSIYPC